MIQTIILTTLQLGVFVLGVGFGTMTAGLYLETVVQCRTVGTVVLGPVCQQLASLAELSLGSIVLGFVLVLAGMIANGWHQNAGVFSSDDVATCNMESNQ